MYVHYRERRRIGVFVLVLGLVIGACGGDGDTSPPSTLSARTLEILDLVSSPPSLPPFTPDQIREALNTPIPSFTFSQEQLEAIRQTDQQRLFCTNYTPVVDDGELGLRCVEWGFDRFPPNFRCDLCPDDVPGGLTPDPRWLDGLDLNNPAGVLEDPGWSTRLRILAESAEAGKVSPAAAAKYINFWPQVEALRPQKPNTFQAENLAAGKRALLLLARGL